MKKVQCLLFFCLTIAIGHINAQSSTRDSMMNNKKSMQRDSGRMNNTNRERDSMMRSNRNMTNQHRNMNGQDSGWINNSNRNRDSMMRNNMNGLDSGSYSNTGIYTPDVSNWPEASRMAVEEITEKYGPPDFVNDAELIWIKKGVWNKICITKNESKHSFPIEHTDNMTTTISYKVPVDKMDDLGRFDGSVTFDRTQGTLSARCDKEANNILALNLAHDIIKGKKTVEQARKAYGDIVKSKMNGADPAYMKKLTFLASTKASDPDINTTGLTKEDVSKGIKKNEKNKLKK